MRPLYESSNDRRRELEAIKRLLGGRSKTAKKLPMRYGIDFAIMTDGKVTAWAEVKCRDNDSNLYPTLMISAAKIWTGLNASRQTGLPFFIVVEWTDRIGFLKITSTEDIHIGFGGRTDRNDDQDVEPVYFIPISMFKMKED